MLLRIASLAVCLHWVIDLSRFRESAFPQMLGQYINRWVILMNHCMIRSKLHIACPLHELKSIAIRNTVESMLFLVEYVVSVVLDT